MAWPLAATFDVHDAAPAVMTTAPAIWHLIAGEYPPRPGGVSDYSCLLARALAESGKEVHVWTTGSEAETAAEPGGAIVHRVAGSFAPLGLLALSRNLKRFPKPRRILVQYVPHAYGWKALNLPFALWVYARGRWHGDDLRTMFHEVQFPWVRRPLRHNIIAAVNRVMTRFVVHGSRRMYVSTPAWEPMLRKAAGSLDAPIIWTPVPALVASAADSSAVQRFRNQLSAGPIVGHFGTYGGLISAVLVPTLLEILARRGDVVILLLGRHGDRGRAELLRDHPEWEPRIVATGGLTSENVAAALRACDVAIQPFPHGVSARRSSIMAVIANGVPVVTNLGSASEPLWSESGLSVCPTEDPALLARIALELLDDAERRAAAGAAGRKLYEARFTWQQTVDALLRDDTLDSTPSAR